MFAVRRLVAVAVGAGLLLVSGCGGEDAEPEAAPSSPASSPSASPSESESPGELEMPDAAKQKNQAGAEAFLEHWIRASRHAAQTGNTKPVQKLSKRECESCRSTVTWARELHAEGGSAKSEPWSILRLSELAPRKNANEFTIRAVVKTPRQSIKNGDGTTQQVRATEQSLEIELEWLGEGWAIEEWVVIQ